MQLKKFILFITLFVFILANSSYSQDCIELDGNSSYVDCGNNSSLNTANVTVEVWVKAASSQNGAANIIDKHHTATFNQGWALEFGVPYVYFWNFTSGGGNNVATSTFINDNNWHHIAATYNGDSSYIYVDGVRENGSKTNTGNIQYDPANKLYIGTAGDYLTVREYTGLIEEVRIWNVALSKQTIREWMTKELDGTHPNQQAKASNLVAYYKLNTNVADSAGTNHGTIVGGVTYYSGSTPMGVELTDFYYSCKENNTTEIYWTTASEINNSHFELQKSYDTKNYEVVERIDGAGYNNSPLYYKVVTPSNSEVVYYRLKQIDFDGRYKYYGPISVVCNNKELEVEVYPNPFQDMLSIRMNSKVNSQLKLNIYDIHGKMVKEAIIKDNRQLNQISLNEDLPSGLYIIKIESGGDIFISKAIKE